MDNFIEGLANLFKDGGVGTYFGIAAFFILAISVVIQAMSGFINGSARQVAKTLFTLLAAVTAFIIVNTMCDRAFSAFDGTTAEDLVETISSVSPEILTEDIKSILLEIDPEAIEYLSAIIFSPIAAPVLFLIFFLVLNAVLRIIYLVIKWIFKLPNIGGLIGRIFGTAVGAAHGFLFAAIIILPFTVAADAADAVIRAEIEAEDDSALAADYEENIKPVTNHFAFKTVKALGGEAVLDAFGNVKNDRAEFNAREEFFSVMNGVIADFSAAKDIEFNKMSAEDKETVDRLVDLVDGSEFLKVVLAELLSISSDKVGEKLDTVNEDSDKVVDAIVDILKSTDKNTIHADLDSLSDILFILSDCGFLNPDENTDLSRLLSEKDAEGKTVIDRVRGVIKSNKRLLPIDTALVKTALSNMSSGGDIPVTAETYDSVKNGFNDILAIKKADPDDTEAYNKYVSDVSATIGASLEREGITLEKEIVDDAAVKVAEYINTNLTADTEELTEEQFNDLILDNYDIFLKLAESDGEITE